MHHQLQVNIYAPCSHTCTTKHTWVHRCTIYTYIHHMHTCAAHASLNTLGYHQTLPKINIYVMHAMRESQHATPMAVHFQWCRPTTSGTVLMGTNRKEDSPVKTAHRVIEVMLTGCNGVSKGIVASQTLTATTTQSNTLEGSRLQKWGRVSASILACMSTPSKQSNSEPKGTPGPRMAQHSVFYRENPWCHTWACDVTDTSWDDVTSIPHDVIPWCYVMTV